RPPLPFAQPRDARPHSPSEVRSHGVDTQPARQSPSRLSFSDPGGSRDFSPRPSDASGARPYPTGPATPRSGEVQTPHTSSAPTPASTPMPRPPARPGLRYVMIGGLVCGAAVAIYLLTRNDQNTQAEIPSASPSIAAPVSVALPATCPPEMIMITGATFSMGSNDGRPDERPAHDVKVEAFCMDVNEVTGIAYQRCVDQNHCDAPTRTVNASTTTKSPLSANDRSFESSYCQDPKRDAAKYLPMNCVSWTEANTYCRVQGKRLPTEEEWEFTAR